MLINATDEGSSVAYNVAYGTNGTAEIMGASVTATSFVIYSLTRETAYSFLATASDASGNANTSPITLTVTTISDLITDCAGQTDEYANTFETLASGADIRVTVTLLNTVDGLVDILVIGNYYGVEIEITRYDAGNELVLLGRVEVILLQ